MNSVKIRPKGQITLPQEIRKSMDIKEMREKAVDDAVKND